MKSDSFEPEARSDEPAAQAQTEAPREEIARLRHELNLAQRELASLKQAAHSSRVPPPAGSLVGEPRIRETLDHLLEGCQILGFDYRYLYINDAAERHNRRAKGELLGHRYMDMWPDIEQTHVFELIRDCLESRHSHTVETDFTFPDGEVGHFELRIEPVPDGVFILSVNISERRKAEQERELLRKQLAQAQTMEAVGRLSGGLAHDFNNMLAVVVSQSELVLDELGPLHPLAEDLERIREAAQRSAELVEQLLAFARRQTAAPRIIDLNAAITKLLDMLRRLIGENITLRFLPGRDLWPLSIDPSQVDQLLVNLTLNARDAISNTGSVTITTANVASAQGDGSIAPGGDYVQLTVEDDGAGMSAETQRRMFEPFFTTKGQGRGTGLGLATVYGVVKQNRAHIRVWSELGRGTRITIALPRHEGKPTQPASHMPAHPGDNSQDDAGDHARGGTETILLVEDDPEILHVTQRVLHGFGYHILAAGSARAALELSDSYQEPIHLLLSDVIMPDMNGRQLAERLQDKRREMRVLFMSGYTDDVIAQQGLLHPGVELIQKPFFRHVLKARLREVLDRPNRTRYELGRVFKIATE